jgi:uncharacterized membrane protein HdeD (DUF308 family)
MISTLIKNWWLLALCGVLDTILAAVYFIRDSGFHAWDWIAFLGELALAAGACAIAAGIWRSSNGKCWLLVLNGLALSALGLLLTGIFGSRISLRTIAILLAVMALSMVILQLITARSLWRRRHLLKEWISNSAGAISVGFACAFLALGFGWIKLGPGSNFDLLLIASFFGFAAICMLELALRLRSRAIATELNAA